MRMAATNKHSCGFGAPRPLIQSNRLIYNRVCWIYIIESGSKRSIPYLLARAQVQKQTGSRKQ
jgi:hypothetical protein|uniref:Uncharacterized protein n=1 Tax=Picea glauca TaxID=3330 RepID=A0A101M165_PICGL|nr:hypothetical protein ABT39_MTgene3690 [Picea glauca]